jgi:hypothetical protein
MPRYRREDLADEDPSLLFADGFDAAILGVVERSGQDAFVLYDARKCIRILMRTEGMSRDEAEEHFAFNVAGAWVGDRTPGFVWLHEGEDDED